MGNDLIKDFVDKKTLDSMAVVLKSEKTDEIKKCAVKISELFCASDEYKNILDSKDDEKKLISSFNNNLLLLIQKTWVEKNDEALKAEVQYQLEDFCKRVNAGKYASSFSQFFNILETVVYLMFGSQSKQKDFDEYTLRIDPEFGIFWWYVKSLPVDAKWSEDKCRVLILLGMYFLANY